MSQVKRSAAARRRNDVIFIVLLLLVTAVFGAAWYFLRGEGDTVTVTVDGEIYGVYPLSDDTTVEIRNAKIPNARNLLIVKDGVAWVEEASCPDGICAAHKPIRHHNESIVCLPNRVVVTVSATQNTDVDIVA